ncbi:MAG TPA: hypothetical protein VMZ01_01360 [Aestuariivirga sp.]|nr:hypothetical protein [Aestuariivirga sp.]
MKMMKLALLGGAAFAVMTAGAQADDLSALKAEIEALNARVAQLETMPAAPNGYSLMTYSKGDATVVPGNNFDYKLYKGLSTKANIIGIMPTADAPPSTTIEWSGYVYAIVANTDYDYLQENDTPAVAAVAFVPDNPATPLIDERVEARAAIPAIDGYDPDSKTSVIGRAHLRVVGKTDTAVGEVGVRVQLRARYQGVDNDEGRPFFAHEYWGWWAMTPELTLGGGFSSSLGDIGFGMDGACNCWWTDWFSSDERDTGFTTAFDPGDTAQVRLSWASGPISAAIALEESDLGVYYNGGEEDNLALAGQIAYAGDTISGEISAIAYESSYGPYGDGFQVGAGIGFALGSVANISLAAAMGENPYNGDYWGASGLISFGLTDTVSFETGAAWRDYDDGGDLLEVLAGIYYNPVSQLTFGLEAEWADVDGVFTGTGKDTDFTTFDLVSIWRF